MRTALSLKMAYRHVRSTVGRMALSVLAVGLGVGLVVAIRLMNTAVLESFLDAVDGVSGRAALSVSVPDGSSFPDTLVDSVAAVAGVELAVPLVSGVAFPDDGSGELLTVHGVDFTHDADVRLYHEGDADQIVEDTVVFLNDPRSVVLTRQFAERRNLAMGHTIPLVTPTGVQTFTIRGLLEPHGLARSLGGRLVVMDLYAAQRAFAAEGRINQIDVVLDRRADADATRAALAALLPPGLEVREPAVRKDVVRKSIAAFQSMLTAFGLLAVFAGFVICYTRLGAIFEARIWEVGLFRATGLRRSVVFLELLKESILLGAAGAVVGIPLGVFIARVGLPVLATTTSLASGLPVAATPPGLRPSDVALGVALGLGAAVAAALVPAIRTARTSPVAALTMRGREMPAAPAHPSGRGPLILAILIAGLIVAQRASGMRAIGLVTTAVIVLTGCLLSPAFAGYGGRWLKLPWSHWFGPAGRVAASHLARHPRRTALVTATLGVGLGSVFMLSVLAWSFEQSLVSTLSRRMRAHLIITSAFAAGGYRYAPMSQAVVSELEHILGVANAVGEQQRDVPYGDGSIQVDSYDPAAFLDRRVADWPVDRGDPESAFHAVANGDAVAVSRSFANLHATRPGDGIELQTPEGPRTFMVAAITSGQPESAVLLSRELYRRLWHDSLVSWIHVVVEEGNDPQAVAAAIARDLGRSHRLRVLDTAAMIDHWASQARQAFSLQYVTAAIALLLVLVGVGDTLAASVAARTREIGMMRAVGLHRSGVFRIVILEGAAVAVLGLMLAGTVGLALAVFWVEVQFPAILGWSIDLHVPLASVLGTAVVTLALCLAGSFLPSLRAAHLPVTAALRNE
jgi:putative ABC transport system permease protein